MADGSVQEAPFEETDQEVFELVLRHRPRHVLVHPGLHDVIDPVEVFLLEVGRRGSGTLEAPAEGRHQTELRDDLPEDAEIELVQEILLVFSVLETEVPLKVDLADIVVGEEPVQIGLRGPSLLLPVLLEALVNGCQRDLLGFPLQHLDDTLDGGAHGEAVLAAREEPGEMGGVLHAVGEGEDLAFLVRGTVQVRRQDLAHGEGRECGGTGTDDGQVVEVRGALGAVVRGTVVPGPRLFDATAGDDLHLALVRVQVRDDVQRVLLDPFLFDLESRLLVRFVRFAQCVQEPHFRAAGHERLGGGAAVRVELVQQVGLRGNPTGSTALAAIVHREGGLGVVGRVLVGTPCELRLLADKAADAGELPDPKLDLQGEERNLYLAALDLRLGDEREQGFDDLDLVFLLQGAIRGVPIRELPYEVGDEDDAGLLADTEQVADDLICRQGLLDGSAFLFLIFSVHKPEGHLTTDIIVMAFVFAHDQMIEGARRRHERSAFPLEELRCRDTVLLDDVLGEEHLSEDIRGVVAEQLFRLLAAADGGGGADATHGAPVDADAELETADEVRDIRALCAVVGVKFV